MSVGMSVCRQTWMFDELYRTAAAKPELIGAVLSPGNYEAEEAKEG